MPEGVHSARGQSEYLLYSSEGVLYRRIVLLLMTHPLLGGCILQWSHIHDMQVMCNLKLLSCTRKRQSWLSSLLSVCGPPSHIFYHRNSIVHSPRWHVKKAVHRGREFKYSCIRGSHIRHSPSCVRLLVLPGATSP